MGRAGLGAFREGEMPTEPARKGREAGVPLTGHCFPGKCGTGSFPQERGLVMDFHG